MAGYNKRIRALEREVEKIAAHLGLSAPVDEVSTSPLKDWVVPLAHETLTREEVAERCIKAAELKGYKADPDQYYSKPRDNSKYFRVEKEDLEYAFFSHDSQRLRPNTLTTLEAFEAYCGVTREKTRLDWLKELPDGYRERALANCVEWEGRKPTDVCDSMGVAIAGICSWSESPEGLVFWSRVYHHYVNGSPLPDLPVQKPETYEAGFMFMATSNNPALHLPDDTWFAISKYKAWVKLYWDLTKPSEPHTLTRVNQHTVGRFYLVEGEDPNSYESYALCVAEGKFVQPTMSNGVVEVLVVDELFPNQVSLQEVTPAP